MVSIVTAQCHNLGWQGWGKQTYLIELPLTAGWLRGGVWGASDFLRYKLIALWVVTVAFNDGKADSVGVCNSS